MFLKKFILSSSILALSTGIAVANPAPYVGAGLGITTNTSDSFSTGSFRGVPVNLFAGYGGVISQTFYLAGELTGTLGTFELSNTHNLKTTYGYGASIIPGVMLSDHTLAFARAGIVRSRFSDIHRLGKSSISSTQTGGQFGLGLQTSVTQNVDVRGEYDFVAFKELPSDSFGRGSPRSDQFHLDLIYKFD